jgi:fermentation-respiration switch protein FrsA (DUF1100 family)
MGPTKWITGLAALGLACLLTGCSGLFYYPDRSLHYDPANLHLKPEEVVFPSKDGAKLFGWYFRSQSSRPAEATVVFFHGNAQNLSSHYLNLVWILRYPFNLFVFDYQGYGRSEGSPSPEKTTEDGAAALDWAHAKTPSLPLVVFGQSLGGNIALESALQTKDRLPIRLVAVDSTFASYRRMGEQVLRRSFLTWPFQWLGGLLLSDAYAPDGKIASLSPIPLLVIHGTNDRTVELKMGEDIFRQAKEPKDFWEIPGGTHTDVFRHPAYREKFVSRIEQAIGEKK